MLPFLPIGRAKMQEMMGGKVVNPEINMLCPAITPTLGANQLLNTEFTSATTSWTKDGNGAIAQVDSSVTPGVASGGADNGALEVTVGASGATSAYQTKALTLGEWYQLDALMYSPSANSGLNQGRLSPSGYLLAGALRNTAEDTWQDLTSTGRCVNAIATQFDCKTQVATAGDKAYFDRIRVRQITNNTVKLGDRGAKSGTYICHPTVAQYSQAGLSFCFKDANNQYLMIVDRSNVSLDYVRLLSRIGGTWTDQINGTVTYGAARELKVIDNNGTLSLYYNSVLIGSKAIAEDTLGTEVYGFTTLAANTVGGVATSASVNP